MKLSIVIPAHNEEENVGHVVDELRPLLDQRGVDYELVLVDDNSRDGTGAAIEALAAGDRRIKLVSRRPPRGFGRAIREGLEHVTGDAVVVCMADRSDDPHDVVRYWEKLQEGYDCVYGSRFRPGARVIGYPRVKLACNRLVNKCVQLLFWTRCNDLTNAFKAYRRQVIEDCGPYRASHFNITIEMSLSALVRHYRIAEVPVAWYGRTWGDSNLRLREMGRRYLSTLLMIFFERVLIADDLMAEKGTHGGRSEALSDATRAPRGERR